MTYRLQNDPADEPPPEAAVVPEGESAEEVAQPARPPGRLVSLDAYRGFIMLLLATSGFSLGRLAHSPAESPLWDIVSRDRLEAVAFHFDHPPWQSSFVPGSYDATEGSQWLHWKVSFWDLIQPAFMLMVGVAMPFSYLRRDRTGQSAWQRGLHAFLRALVLVLLGVFLQSQRASSTLWIFPNVLSQIGLGYLFVYALLGRKWWVQWSALGIVLVGTWALVHFSPAPADYEPEEVAAHYEQGEVFAPPYRQWSKNGNVFSEFDRWFLNLFPRPEDEGPHEFNTGGYTTLNFVPSIATMILGLLCGQLLLSVRSPGRKLGLLVLAAVVCWGLGVVAGATCCPVVKRIWTPSWVLFSGGYVIGMLALFYLLFDVWPLRKLAFPLVVVGMNSLLVYLLGQLSKSWIAANVMRHFGWAIEGGLGWFATQFRLLEHVAVPDGETAGEVMLEAFGPVVATVSAAAAIWLLCLWLYRQRIFIRI